MRVPGAGCGCWVLVLGAGAGRDPVGPLSGELPTRPENRCISPGLQEPGAPVQPLPGNTLCPKAGKGCPRGCVLDLRSGRAGKGGHTLMARVPGDDLDRWGHARPWEAAERDLCLGLWPCEGGWLSCAGRRSREAWAWGESPPPASQGQSWGRRAGPALIPTGGLGDPGQGPAPSVSFKGGPVCVCRSANGGKRQALPRGSTTLYPSTA